jgi:hypothetical protein
MVFIGWDIPVLPHGPTLLEANVIWDSDLTTLPHGISVSDTQCIPIFFHYFGQAKKLPAL